MYTLLVLVLNGSEKRRHGVVVYSVNFTPILLAAIGIHDKCGDGQSISLGHRIVAPWGNARRSNCFEVTSTGTVGLKFSQW